MVSNTSDTSVFDASVGKQTVKAALLVSVASLSIAMTAPAYGQTIEITDNTPVDNPAGGTVNAAAGVTQTVDDGDNIELEDNSNDNTIINIAGTLINNDTSDEDVVIFVDNSEDDVIICPSSDNLRHMGY